MKSLYRIWGFGKLQLGFGFDFQFRVVSNFVLKYSTVFDFWKVIFKNELSCRVLEKFKILSYVCIQVLLIMLPTHTHMHKHDKSMQLAAFLPDMENMGFCNSSSHKYPADQKRPESSVE